MVEDPSESGRLTVSRFLQVKPASNAGLTDCFQQNINLLAFASWIG
jgi:hypothetical protein